MTIETKIHIVLGQQEITLTPNEARQLYQELAAFMGGERPIPVIYPPPPTISPSPAWPAPYELPIIWRS